MAGAAVVEVVGFAVCVVEVVGVVEVDEVAGSVFLSGPAKVLASDGLIADGSLIGEWFSRH